MDDVDYQWQSLETVRLSWNIYLVQTGRLLTDEEAKETLRDICSSVTFTYNIAEFKVKHCTEFTLSPSISCLPSVFACKVDKF